MINSSQLRDENSPRKCFSSNQGTPLAWFSSETIEELRMPVRDKRGKVIGVRGITRRDEDRMRQHDVREVTVAVQYAREHCHEVVTTAELARAAGVSERHLHRKLRIALDISPYELLLRTRIQSAAEALAKTTLPIIQIALDHAFCDQSAFTQKFRKRTGMTPKEFRRRHQG